MDVNLTPPSAKPLLRTVLGAVLRGIRRHQRRTLSDVADTARVSMQYLSELERGRKEASSEVLAAVCEALRVELSDVLAEVGRAMMVHRVRHARITVATGSAVTGKAPTASVYALAA